MAFFMCKIKVATIFEKSKMKPVWFVLDNRRYDIKDISYEWKTKKGHSTLHHFAVFDGTNSFEIVFDDKEVQWELMQN